MFQFVVSASLASLLALSPSLSAQDAQTPTASPSPSVSAAASNPVLSQGPSGAWTTTVVLQASDACLSKLDYELVITPPGTPASGRVDGHVPIQPPGSAPVACPSATTAQDEQVTVAFTLSSPPLSATLVIIDAKDKNRAAPTTIAMSAVHRYVSAGQYLGYPALAGLLLAFLFAAFCAIFWPNRVRPDGGRLRRPIYASATWTFKDSWATNISLGATTIAAILTGAGAVSTQLPGVQLDRYAVLMAVCGVIIVSAPFFFGILYVLFSRSRPTVQKNATLVHEGPLAIQVPGGANLTVPSPEDKDPIPVTPGTIMIGKDVYPVLPGDNTIVLTERNGGTLKVTGAGGQVAADTVQITSPFTVLPDGDFSFATLKFAGFAAIPLDKGMASRAPNEWQDVKKFSAATTLRVPLGDNLIVADFRSLIPASLVTMFGIGAELGIVGVLAFSLSDRTALIRIVALILVILAALAVLGYAVATTCALADSTPGSALTPDSSTAATL
jgi:hypothetical protein